MSIFAKSLAKTHATSASLEPILSGICNFILSVLLYMGILRNMIRYGQYVNNADETDSTRDR